MYRRSWSDWWGDVMDWGCDNILLPMLVLVTVALIGVLLWAGVSGVRAWRAERNDPWTCVTSHVDHYETRLVLIGKALVPMRQPVSICSLSTRPVDDMSMLVTDGADTITVHSPLAR